MKIKKISELFPQDRPREKLIKYGVNKLNNQELISIILRSGVKGSDIIKISQEIELILKKTSLKEVTFEKLKNIRGLGDVKIGQILASVELGIRLSSNIYQKRYLSPKQIFEELADIRSSKKEHFVVFFLDSRNQEIKKEIISIGTVNSSLVHPREVFEPAIRYLATHIIITHNHPSQELSPSEDDIEITKRLLASSKILGINIIDHIIVSSTNYYSFKANNLLFKNL